jgi:ankyrin repeat protein
MLRRKQMTAIEKGLCRMRNARSGINHFCLLLFVCIAVLPAMAATKAPNADFDILQHDLSQAFTAGKYDRAAQIVTKLAALVDTKRASMATLDSLLIKAVAQADVAAVETILGSGARANVMNAAGLSILAEVAAQCAGRVAIVELLLDNGADPAIGHYTGISAFEHAANSSSGCAHVLVRYGAEVEATSELALRVLISAVRAGDTEAVTLLLDAGHPMDAVDEERDGWSLLMYAADADQGDMVRFLLERGAPVAWVDDTGRTAEQMARSAGRASIAELLRISLEGLSDADADPDADTGEKRRKQTKK